MMLNDGRMVSLEINPWVAKAMSLDVSRENIHGVWFASGHSFATDGRRLHVLKTDTPDRPVLLCPEHGDVTYANRPPPIDQVIPPTIPGEPLILVDVVPLRRALKLADDHYRAHRVRRATGLSFVLLELAGGVMKVFGFNPGAPILDEHGQLPPADERMFKDDLINDTPIASLATGEGNKAFRAKFQTRYLIDAISGAKGKIQWQQQGTHEPLKITRADGGIAVVMPVKL